MELTNAARVLRGAQSRFWRKLSNDEIDALDLAIAALQKLSVQESRAAERRRGIVDSYHVTPPACG